MSEESAERDFVSSWARIMTWSLPPESEEHEADETCQPHLLSPSQEEDAAVVIKFGRGKSRKHFVF